MHLIEHIEALYETSTAINKIREDFLPDQVPPLEASPLLHDDIYGTLKSAFNTVWPADREEPYPKGSGDLV